MQNLYYRWSKDFLEAGKKRLAGDTARAATSDEVKDLRREASALKEVVAELTLENRLLKKSMIGGWGGRRMRYSGIARKLEIIQLVEQSAICRCDRTLEKLGIPEGDFLSLVRSLSQPAGPRPWAIARPGRIASGTGFLTMVRERIIRLALDEPALVAARAGRALHRHGKAISCQRLRSIAC